MNNKENDNKKIYNIGVLIGNAHSNHPKEVVRGLDQGAKDFDVNVLFFLGIQSSMFSREIRGNKSSEDYDYQTNTIYDYVHFVDLDVLIISFGTIGTFLDRNEKKRFLDKFPDIPKIILEEEWQDNHIISDNYHSMRKIMEHLVNHHGYAKIAHISGPIGNLEGERRRQAYLDVMEENHLHTDETKIEYGDYSEFSEELVGKLLENHPDLEAIVCANDEMAVGAYKECIRRGMRIGDDIAITGYDDYLLAKSMDPPLTTADQNGYEIGYRAMKEAIKKCLDPNIQFAIKMPATFRRRNSCGCKSGEDMIFLVEGIRDAGEIAAKISKRCILNREDEGLCDYIEKQIKKLIELILVAYKEIEEGLNGVDIEGKATKIVRKIVDGPYCDFVEHVYFLDYLNRFMKEEIMLESSSLRKLRLMNLITVISEYINSIKYMRKEEAFTRFRRKAWMGPLHEKELIENIENEQLVLFEVLAQLRGFHVRNSFLLLFDEPIIYKKDEEWEQPESLCLAAKCIEDRITVFEPEERIKIDVEKDVLTYLPAGKGHSMSAFALFSKENQYGVLICEAKAEDITSIYVNSLQIGTVLRFMELTKQKQEAQEQLEESLNLIQKKNKVLNFISEYDELTKVLNRRGFGEGVLKLNKEYAGERGCFIFADLDHLKEINDRFGHSEGDIAIIASSEILRGQIEEMGEKGIIGRLGGDEFVIMAALEESYERAEIVDNIEKAFRELNETSGKPYYIECSLGVTEFEFTQDFELDVLLRKADGKLYEAKRQRRDTIIK